jgi:peptide deformylase
MAIIPIRRLPDPVLREKAKRVKMIDKSICKLVDDMIETMEDAPGVGLAAPQIGIPLRIVVIGLPEKEPMCLINPKVVRKSGERTVEEGCLSLPGWVADVKRSEKVTVVAQDKTGKEVRIKGDKLLAQALEHEIDHLNGIIYIDYLESPDMLRKVKPKPAPSEESAEDSEPQAAKS